MAIGRAQRSPDPARRELGTSSAARAAWCAQRAPKSQGVSAGLIDINACAEALQASICQAMVLVPVVALLR